jgi:ATP-dependent Clp protease protease subunit
MHPMVYEKTRDGEALYDIYSRLVKDRIIFLKSVIDEDEATTICATLLFLDSQPPKKKKPISIYINSPGGLVHPGLWTIYDTMTFISSPVRTVCIGEAYSAAASLLMAGEKGMRLAFPNSRMMIHNVQSGTVGAAHEIEKSAALIKHTNDAIVKLVMKHTKQKEKIVREAMKEEKYFTAEEAVKWGIIDKIIEPKSFKCEDA